MKERYSSRWTWFRQEERAVECEQTCELGTRTILVSMISVIYRAANRHVDRCQPASPRWG